MKTSNPARNAAICKAYQDGLSLEAIGRQFSITGQRIGQILRQNGVPKREPDLHTYDPEYDTWCGMKTRCYNPNYREYHLYGGRGITICPEWKESYVQFLRDVGRRPSPEHTLDRINRNGNYEPGNCHWASKREQSLNRSNTFLIAAFDETQCATDWSRDPRCNVSLAQLRLRIKNGMPPEEAITKPSQMSRFRSETHKQCSHCQQIKPRSEFNIHRPNAREKHKAICKTCQHPR